MFGQTINFLRTTLVTPDSGQHYGKKVTLVEVDSTSPNVEPILKNACGLSYLHLDSRRLLDLFLDRDTEQGTRHPCRNQSQVQWFEFNSKTASHWSVIDPAAGPGLYAACLADAGTSLYLGIEREKVFVSFAETVGLPSGFSIICSESPRLLFSLEEKFNVSLLSYEILNSLEDSAILIWLLSLRRVLGKKSFMFGDFRAPSVCGNIQATYTLLYNAEKGSVFSDFAHNIRDTFIYDETRLRCYHDIYIIDSTNGKAIARHVTNLRLIVPEFFFRLCNRCGYEVVAATELFPATDAGFTLPSRSISFICQVR